MLKKMVTEKRHMRGNKKGFTLIEMVVAVFVLTLAIGAPLYSAALALKISREAQNRVVADYLAQEAIEFLRNRRDENILNGASDPFQNILSLSTCSGSGGGQCFVDVYAKIIKDNWCGYNGAVPVDCTLISYRDDANGNRHYGHNYVNPTFTTPTQFHRIVRWLNLPGVAAEKFWVEVTWPSTGGGTNMVSETVYLFPYK